MRRVVMVDDDVITRRGLASVFHDFSDIDARACLSILEALDAPQRLWLETDVVLIDPVDLSDPDDHFPGVSVVERIRRSRSPWDTTVVVMSNFHFDSALAWRMDEAGADFIYGRAQLQTAANVREAICNPRPERALPVEIDLDLAVRHGISRFTRVNEAVRAARSMGLLGCRHGWQSRRRETMRIRRDFNALARLAPINQDGLPPSRDQQDPSTIQIERFLVWATRVKPGEAAASERLPSRVRETRYAPPTTAFARWTPDIDPENVAFPSAKIPQSDAKSN